MTDKLIETFNLPTSDDLIGEIRQIKEIEARIENVATITDLSTSDKEMDELASKAIESFDELMNLGMNVEQRYAAPIFDAASKMLGHAVLAKTAKLDKKLKAIDLELKRQRIQQTFPETEMNQSEGSARVLDRNELAKLIKGQ